MKRAILTLCFGALLSFASKQVFAENNNDDRLRSIAALKSAYTISDWQSVSSWNKMQADGKIYYEHTLTSADINSSSLNNGLMLVFLKFDSFNQVFKERPLSLPAVLIPDEHSEPTYWSYVTGPNKLSVQYAMDNQVDMNPQVNVRYVWVSNEFIAAHQLTTPAVKNMNYKQVVNLLGISK